MGLAMKLLAAYFLTATAAMAADQGTISFAELPVDHAAYVDDIGDICYRKPFIGLLVDAQVRPVGQREEWVSIMAFKPGDGTVSLRAEPFGVRADGTRIDYTGLRAEQARQIAANPCGEREFVRATIGGEVALVEWYNSVMTER